MLFTAVEQSCYDNNLIFAHYSAKQRTIGKRRKISKDVSQIANKIL